MNSSWRLGRLSPTSSMTTGEPRAIGYLIPCLETAQEGSSPGTSPGCCTACSRTVRQARTLIELMPFIEQPEQKAVAEAVLQCLGGITYEPDRGRAIELLIPVLPEAFFSIVLQQIEEIQDESVRGRTLRRLGQRLPEHLLGVAINVARRIAEDTTREEALAGLAPDPAKVAPSALCLLLAAGNSCAASARNRPDFLTDLRTLVPIAASLGGNDAVLEIYRAIEDVTRWWP